MINFVDHKSYLSLLDPNGCNDTVITFIIKPGLGEITCLYKMDSTTMPKLEDVRDCARDLEDEYESGAGLKVREQTIYYVTKENPQRGAANTTCTGPCRAERRPETCGPMMTSIRSPVERDYAIAIIQDMEMVRGEAHSTDSLDICLYPRCVPGLQSTGSQAGSLQRRMP